MMYGASSNRFEKQPKSLRFPPLRCSVSPSQTHPDIIENHACAQSVGRNILAIIIIIPGGHRRGIAVACVPCFYSAKEFANFAHCRKPIVRAVGQAPEIRNIGCQ